MKRLREPRLTGTQEYITPANNERVVNHLAQVNHTLHDRLLREHEWSIDEDVFEMLRIDNEELLLWFLKRISQFASFRAQKTQETTKGGRNPQYIKVTEEDVNNAWDAIQLEKLK